MKIVSEISYKAGEKLSLEKQGLAYLEGKQSGIKLVVEWIQDRLERYKVAPKLIGFTMLTEEWESQKKEWGIE